MNIIILMVEVKTIDNKNLRRIADLLDPSPRIIWRVQLSGAPDQAQAAD